MTQWHLELANAQQLDPTPGIDMLVEFQHVDREELINFILVKYLTEAEDTLRLFNANTLLTHVREMRELESPEDKAAYFDTLLGYLDWVVMPLERNDRIGMVVPREDEDASSG